MDRFYNPQADGYCGDEDNGQTSAWYVFSALGFYPVAPGTTQYAFGAPLFKKATIHFENGNTLVINAPDNDATHFYVDKIQINGYDYTKNYCEHSDLLEGGTVNVIMSTTPNRTRGIEESDLPYSFSTDQNNKLK